jgi:nitrite reductase/ring-hydroxylating ferredoxin subunit
VKLVGSVPLRLFDESDLVKLSYPPYDVVVVKTEAGFRALEDACTHAGASLAEGWVEDGCLLCPVHQYAFDLDTGALVRPKGLCEDQRTFVTRVEGDAVVVYDPFKLVLVGI